MFFFHHIGVAGSQRDFPKTVDSPLAIADFEDYFVDDPGTLIRLRTRFPSGFCNAWGVPEGAKSVIRQMHDGDHVLLVANTAGEGSVPVLGSNVLVAGGDNWELSRHYWGESKFPFIFFFDSLALDMTWREMCRDLGFSESWHPRYFFRIPEERLEPFGGDIGYLAHIMRNYGQFPAPFAHPTAEDETRIGERFGDLEYELALQLAELQSDLQAPPALKGYGKQKVNESLGFARSKAFRLAVLRAYNWRCAVCGLSVTSPQGAYALDAAHIYPKSMDGSDDVRNGLALCALHHWAMDVGWFSLADDCTIIGRQGIPESDDYSFIRKFIGTQIALPSNTTYAPHPIFLEQHRLAHGFELPKTDDAKEED